MFIYQRCIFFRKFDFIAPFRVLDFLPSFLANLFSTKYMTFYGFKWKTTTYARKGRKIF